MENLVAKHAVKLDLKLPTEWKRYTVSSFGTLPTEWKRYTASSFGGNDKK
jgi:hypothetical protein